MRLENVGGTKGGLGTFAFGAALALAAVFFFIDSVRVNTYGSGVISGGFGGFGGTGSIGIVFLPLFVAVVALFYDASKAWAWGLLGLGTIIIFIEILSKLRFFFDLKLSHVLIMLVSFAGGLGLMLRSLRAIPAAAEATS